MAGSGDGARPLVHRVRPPAIAEAFRNQNRETPLKDIGGLVPGGERGRGLGELSHTDMRREYTAVTIRAYTLRHGSVTR